MLRMCVYMHSRFVENHPIRILEDGPLISEVVLSQWLNLPDSKYIVSSITALSSFFTSLSIFYFLII
jgi:hypothetical protein